MSTIGYQEKNFIQGMEVPMPTLTPKISGAAYRSNHIKDEIYLNYVHYSIVMNKETKQLIFAASNIDQNLGQRIPRSDSMDWDTDSRIVPEELQLDNRFYKGNDWDRGHMVQRNNNNWGKNRREAIKANDDTFFYTNAAFQHKFFNQDEWLKLESFIGNWKEDSDGKLCVFTGPIHLPFDRIYARTWHDTVRIPSGFFKIVCFKSKTSKKLESRAFILYQDSEFIGNKKRGSSVIKLKNYQVTVAEIEELTGLDFHPEISKNNPLYYSEGKNTSVNNYPERIPIEHIDDIVTEIDAPRITQDAPQGDKNIAISAAMINPKGRDRKKDEWVTLLNLTPEIVDLDGWKLCNDKNQSIDLSKKKIDPGVAIKVTMDEGDMRLTNKGSTIILKNKKGEVVDREYYINKDAILENLAFRF
jgi:endonuclease G, mitochondrial